MKTLKFLAGLCFATILSAAPSQTWAAENRQPNILFIFADDHGSQALSAYKHPLKLLETPNIDRLAKEGVLFERCLVPNPICGPSRAVILTGKYSHLNGFYRNGNRFNGQQQTFPKLLQKAGYQTALIGKWHLESDPTGFDHWDILPGQGIYYNPPMIRKGQRIKHHGYTSDLITDFSIEWLKQRDKSKPFLLMTQHKAPHREWSPNLKNLGWNKGRVFPEPDTLFDDYSGRGRAEREQDMTIEKTMDSLDTKLTTPPFARYRATQSLGCLLRASKRSVSQGELTGKRPGPLALSAVYARLPRDGFVRGRKRRPPVEVSG